MTQYVYQTYGTNKIIDRKHVGVIAPPGSGKTRMILDALRAMNAITNLVLCSGSAVATWKRQIPQWYGKNVRVTVVGSGALKKPAARIAFWNSVVRGEYKGFVICNYALFRQDFVHIYGRVSRKAIHWDAVISDEYHKAFRGHKTQTFKNFRSLARSIPIAIAASGTALGKAPNTLWTLFHICDPRMFGSYWKFVKTFCLVDDDDEMGARIYGPKRSAEPQLKALMDRYFAYIPDEVVASQLPEGKRMTFDVEMTPQQSRVYEELTEEMVATFTREGGIDDFMLVPNTLALHVALKKLLCCPKLIDPSLGLGGGFEAIWDTLDEQPHVIIFVPFREAVDVFVEELRVRGKDAIALYGGLGEDEQQRRVNHFRESRGIMVCTIQYAESFDCETCDTSFFLGYIGMLDQHTQAEGRTRRAISKHAFVKWYYVCYSGTIDDTALSNIGQSLTDIARILQRPQAFIDALTQNVQQTPTIRRITCQ